MKAIKDWWKTLLAIIFIVLVVSPVLCIRIIIGIITLGVCKWPWPTALMGTSWAEESVHKIVGKDHWLSN